MPPFLLGLGKMLAPVAKWVGLNIVVPWLLEMAKGLKQKIDDRIAHGKVVKQAEQGNAKYEEKPSASTFGDSP